MPAISIPNGSSGASTLDELAKTILGLQGQLQQVQSQLNAYPSYNGLTNGKSATGVAPGSLQARSLPSGGIGFAIADSTKTFSQEFVLQSGSTGGSVIFQTGTGAPTTTTFPTAGTFAWYHDTTSGKYWWVYNDGGTIVEQSLSTLSGSISASQHGNLSGAGGTDHDFTQISGTITDTQHGSRSGGTLHSQVTTGADGFMIAADKVKLNTITNHLASATFDINANTLYVGNVQVLTGQLAHVANATNAVDVITQLNAFLATAQAKGLMA